MPGTFLVFRRSSRGSRKCPGNLLEIHSSSVPGVVGYAGVPCWCSVEGVVGYVRVPYWCSVEVPGVVGYSRVPYWCFVEVPGVVGYARVPY